jgi:hypothetical protein
MKGPQVSLAQQQTILRPDGSEAPGSPIIGSGLVGPWAAVVDGNDGAGRTGRGASFHETPGWQQHATVDQS